MSTLHKTEYGALVIKRDATKIRVTAWLGDVMNGKGELILLAALRDRRFDGTARTNDSALISFPYDDPVYHKRLPVQLLSAELSIYGFAPRSRIAESTGEPEFHAFIEKPFTFLSQPELFRQYFERVWKTTRAPGQAAAPLADVSKLSLPGFERVARRHGYDALECAASHYHVAQWVKSKGYRYTAPEQANTLAALQRSINELREKGLKLSRQQESWLAVIQSLRPVELIPKGFYFNGPIWPQDNIGPESLWMHKPLSDKASGLLSAQSHT